MSFDDFKKMGTDRLKNLGSKLEDGAKSIGNATNTGISSIKGLITEFKEELSSTEPDTGSLFDEYYQRIPSYDEIINIPLLFEKSGKENDSLLFYQNKPYMDYGYTDCWATVSLSDITSIWEPSWKTDIISLYHKDNSLNEGLIDIQEITCKSGDICRYFLLKSRKKTESEDGYLGNYCYRFHAYFQKECGTVSVFCESCNRQYKDERESEFLKYYKTYSDYSNPYITEEEIKTNGWYYDPFPWEYDINYISEPVLMNKSEAEEYDIFFPTHPLTEIRKLLRYLIEYN